MEGPPIAVAGSPAPDSGDYGGIVSSLAGTESGGSFDAQNNETGSSGRSGHFGRLQFGQDRLDEAKAALGMDFTPKEFMANPELQQQVENWHLSDIDKYIKDNHLDQFIGQDVGGTPLTLDSMRAVAHLGGKGGLNRYLTSGGQHNPSDAFGTHLSDYASKHANTQSSEANLKGGMTIPGSTAEQIPSMPRIEIDLKKADTFLRDAISAGANPNVVMGYLDQVNQLASNTQDRISEQTTINKIKQDMGFRPREFDLKQQEFELKQQKLGAKSQENNYGKAPSGYRWTGDGNLQPIAGGPAEKPTETQRAVGGYVDRMAHVENRIDNFFDKGKELPSFWEHSKLTPNFLKSDDGQQYLNLASQWIRAKLRRESGAAISASEWEEEYKTFFPQPGDGTETIDEKRQARQVAQESMGAQAGHAPRTITSGGGGGLPEGWSVEVSE